MISYIKRYRFQITLFFFLLIPIIAIDTSTRAPREYHFHDRVIIAITTPIQSAVQWSLDVIVNAYQNYIYLRNTRHLNVALLEENRKLISTISGLKEIEHENARLRNLLDFREQQKLQSVTARVIAKDVSSEFRALRINRGENAGIKKDMPVVTNEGIVGRVLRTSPSTADVITILDPLSAVDGIVARSRVRGVVEGFSDESCQLKFVQRTDDIQVGDELVSSGLGGVFPKGIPVGTVSKVRKKNYGISQEIEVRPAVEFYRLEEVLVITETERQIIESPKKKEASQ